REGRSATAFARLCSSSWSAAGTRPALIAAITSRWRRRAARRVCTASASRASRCASAGGRRGGGGAACFACPQPARLQAVSETISQRLGQATLADLLLRALDRVGDAAVERTPRVEVEHEVGRARVAVARLADGAGVEDEAAVREVDLRAARDDRAVDPAAL